MMFGSFGAGGRLNGGFMEVEMLLLLLCALSRVLIVVSITWYWYYLFKCRGCDAILLVVHVSCFILWHFRPLGCCLSLCFPLIFGGLVYFVL